MKKKTYIWIGIALLVMAGIGMGVWYIADPENKKEVLPTLEKSVYTITEITDSTTVLSAQLMLHNPLPVPMKIHHLDCSLTMGGTEILKDTYSSTVEIRANADDTLRLPMTFLNKNLVAITKKLAHTHTDSTTYAIRVVFYLDVPMVGKKEITLTRERVLPVFYVPRIKLENVKLKKIGLRESELLAQVRIINKNGFMCRLQNPTYTLQLGKQESFVEGKLPDMTTIRAHSNEVYPVTMQLQVNDLPEVAWEYLKKGKQMSYMFSFSSVLMSDEPLIDKSQLKAVSYGTLKDMDELKEASRQPAAR